LIADASQDFFENLVNRIFARHYYSSIDCYLKCVASVKNILATYYLRKRYVELHKVYTDETTPVTTELT